MGTPGGSQSGCTTTLLGYSLCMPDDPYAPPLSAAAFPNNVYGCRNTTELTITCDTSHVSFVYQVPDLFVDAYMSYLSSGADCYFSCTGAEITVVAVLITGADGTRQVGDVTSYYATAGDVTFHCTNSTYETVGNLIPGLFADMFVGELSGIFATYTAELAADLPPYDL